MGFNKDLTGVRFGKLVAQRYAGTNKHRQTLWEVLCDCGKTKVVTQGSLHCGNVKSCGCSRRENKNNAKIVVGDVFGMLTVQKLFGKTSSRDLLWDCMCKCGRTVKKTTAYLLRQSKHAKSCGCYRFGKPVDLTGKVFSRLTVIGPVPVEERGVDFWYCQCSCGATSVVSGRSLRNEIVKSCGCLRKLNMQRLHTKISTRKGLSRTPEYAAWRSMRTRCLPTAKGHATYYDLGVRVCEEWLDRECGFDRFLAHVGNKPTPGHSLDRIDCAKGYFPGNVRWSTGVEQAANVRKRVRLEQWLREELTAELHRRGFDVVPKVHAQVFRLVDYAQKEDVV